MNRIVFGLLLALIAISSVVQWSVALKFGHDSWQLTEWLINYQGGFVRRGLSGELFHALAHLTGIRATRLVVVFSYVVYVVFSILFYRMAKNAFHPVFIVSCFVLAFPACQDSIVRKDCFLLLCFLTSLRLLRLAKPTTLAMVQASLISVIAVLIHEAYVFFALPAFVVFTWPLSSGTTAHFKNRGIVIGGLLLSGFIVAALNHGDVETARRVNISWFPLWQSTNPESELICQPAAAIQAIGWTPEKGLSLGLDLLTSGLYQPLAWLMLFTTSFFLVIAFSLNLVCEDCPNGRLIGILLVQFAAISPLFLLGFDYGRWLFFWLASSMILHANGASPPAWLNKIGRAMLENSHFHFLLASLQQRAWVLLFIGVPVCWNTREFLLSCPIVRFLHLAGFHH
ncbi:MAG: hypothetical protein ACKO2G_16475 [Verrucomicrobiales bacterium]